MSKAFDKVRYSKLFKILIDKGMSPLVSRLLIIMYSNIKAQVKWQGTWSDRFQIRNGVKQGGVMSPLLFTLYVDILIRNLRVTRMGCYIGNVCSAAFVYADDIVLLAPTRKAMQTLLDTCEKFGEEFGLTYNPDKCETLVFNNDNNTTNFDLKLQLCNKDLKLVKKTKHLGHTLLNSRFIFDMGPMISDLKMRTNAIQSN
ncbi:MAG: reverse transcriptase domain-containing protein, partial [Bacteroidota bacterium]